MEQKHHGPSSFVRRRSSLSRGKKCCRSWVEKYSEKLVIEEWATAKYLLNQIGPAGAFENWHR